MAKKKATKKATKKDSPAAPAASEPTAPGSAPTEPTPPANDPTKGGVQAKVAKAGKQSKDSCEGCQYDYDSSKDPQYPTVKKPQRLCTHGSPPTETGGKKLSPCPAEGEGIGKYELTPEEAKLIHERRIKQGNTSPTKR